MPLPPVYNLYASASSLQSICLCPQSIIYTPLFPVHKTLCLSSTSKSSYNFLVFCRMASPQISLCTSYLAGRGLKYPPPLVPSLKKIRAYLYSPCWPSWSALGRTLSFIPYLDGVVCESDLAFLLVLNLCFIAASTSVHVCTIVLLSRWFLLLQTIFKTFHLSRVVLWLARQKASVLNCDYFRCIWRGVFLTDHVRNVSYSFISFLHCILSVFLFST